MDVAGLLPFIEKPLQLIEKGLQTPNSDAAQKMLLPPVRRLTFPK